MFDNDQEFENEVRRIARELWPSAAFSGATLHLGRERDGIFITDDMVHLLECTTSHRKEKAQQDIDKLVTLCHDMRRTYSMKGIKAWFVTADEPTADQRAVATHANKQLHALAITSYRQFKGQLINADTYLDHRKDYPFVSAQ